MKRKCQMNTIYYPEFRLGPVYLSQVREKNKPTVFANNKDMLFL